MILRPEYLSQKLDRPLPTKLDVPNVSEIGCSFNIALAIAACHCALPGRYAARRCFCM
jgi:hypothetical protein